MEKLCQNCNRPNPPEAAFCRHCASPLAPGQGDARQANANQGNVNQGQYGNQQWNQPNVGGQGQQNFSQPSGGAGQKAVAALILAVAGLLCCGPFTGIPAAIVGWMEIGAIKEGRSAPNGMWMAQVGLWGGIAVSIIHTVLGVIFGFLSMLSSPGYY